MAKERIALMVAKSGGNRDSNLEITTHGYQPVAARPQETKSTDGQIATAQTDNPSAEPPNQGSSAHKPSDQGSNYE